VLLTTEGRLAFGRYQGHRYGQPSRLFCLAGIDRLSYEVQRRTAHAIRELHPEAIFPLLMVMIRNHTSHDL
jgi:hypothetical protein